MRSIRVADCGERRSFHDDDRLVVGLAGVDEAQQAGALMTELQRLSDLTKGRDLQSLSSAITDLQWIQSQANLTSPTIQTIVGKVLGMLDGTHQTEEIKTVVISSPREAQPLLTRLMESLHQYECLRSSSQASTRQRWFDVMQDRDTVHLGHAALLYRQQDNLFLFDPALGLPVPGPDGVKFDESGQIDIQPATLAQVMADE